ncbi:hypothetical protein Q31b_27100 [Novipirellula aureliae]|uniref:Nickel uptake substrate-specific transmembrane region n=1 Tax=Novipirellula aureliae TaxID=2527966 RepID=A0A5C6E0U1_9BACT|nr:carboxypeptidase-like regulatory domain-containing protein [Novipirellula aureliae]TWU41271.1 hypothetical protein Q31b_27100 [Novipirellula aureliae]
MFHLKSISGLLVIACCSIAVFGCSSEPAKGVVTGVVTKNGKPLDGVLVSFMPDSLKGTDAKMSRATTDDQGHYRLVYTGSGREEGAAAGWHRVTIEDLASENYRGSGPPPAPRVSPIYMDPSATPFSIEVKPGEQEIDLDVKSNR